MIVSDSSARVFYFILVVSYSSILVFVVFLCGNCKRNFCFVVMLFSYFLLYIFIYYANKWLIDWLISDACSVARMHTDAFCFTADTVHVQGVGPAGLLTASGGCQRSTFKGLTSFLWHWPVSTHHWREFKALITNRKWSHPLLVQLQTADITLPSLTP